MPVSVIKNSFNSGEWSPSLYGRSDLEKYRSAVKTMKNFIIHPHGGASKRGGTQFIGEVKDSSVYTRLIPFQFSVTQSYIIEVGNEYMRFYKDQGRILESEKNITGITNANPGVITSASHGFSDGDWVYISSVSGMTELNGKIFVVSNSTTNTFELNDIDSNNVDTTSFSSYISGGIVARVYEISTPYVTVDIPKLKFVQSADTLYLTHPSYAPRKLTRSSHTAWTLNTITFASSVSAPTGLSMTGTAESYVITAVINGEESLASSSVTGDNGNTLTWVDPGGVDYWYIYKDEYDSGTYGWVGQADINSFTVPAGGITADMDKTPPNSINPFSGTDNYPGCAMFHQQRLIFARTNNNPQTFWGSTTGAYENHNYSTPTKDDDAYEFTINSQQVNEIRWMAPLQVLLMGTSGSEWQMSPGSQSDAITPSSILLQQQSKYGVSDHLPISVGTGILFIEGNKKRIRDIKYNYEVNSFAGEDLTLFAPHLFERFTITEWAFQQNPDSIVWVGRNDGRLLGMTYYKEHDVFGWHHHETDGEFESIANIKTSEGVDEIWSIVKREINGNTRRYIEIFKEGMPTADIKDAWYVDCGLNYEGSPITTITGLGHLEGKEVVILADGNVMSSKTVFNGSITIEESASKIQIGLPFTSELETLELDMQGNGNTIQGDLRAINSATIRLKDTRELFIGGNSSNAKEIKFRTNENYGEPIQPFSGDKPAPLYPTDLKEARVYMKSVNPVPCTILALIMKVQYGTN